MTMKSYLLSFAAGLLAGVICNALGARLPAPPVVALIGLLAILLGEQMMSFARQTSGAKAPGVLAVAPARAPIFEP